MRIPDEHDKRHWSLRAWSLLITSIICVTRGILYLPPLASGREPLPTGVDYIIAAIPRSFGSWSWQPVWLLGAAWLAVGVGGIWHVASGHRPQWSFLAAEGLMVMWAIGYAAATMFAGSKTAWAQAMLYLILAGYTEIGRRIVPTVRVTPAIVEAKLRHTPDGDLEYLHDGQWVTVRPITAE